MSRSAKYVEDLTIALFKLDSEGMEAIHGYVDANDFDDEDPEFAEAIRQAATALEELDVIIQARRDEYEIEVS